MILRFCDSKMCRARLEGLSTKFSEWNQPAYIWIIKATAERREEKTETALLARQKKKKKILQQQNMPINIVPATGETCLEALNTIGVLKHITEASQLPLNRPCQKTRFINCTVNHQISQLPHIFYNYFKHLKQLLQTISCLTHFHYSMSPYSPRYVCSDDATS